jgi:hypothetical protein
MPSCQCRTIFCYPEPGEPNSSQQPCPALQLSSSVAMLAPQKSGLSVQFGESGPPGSSVALGATVGRVAGGTPGPAEP